MKKDNIIKILISVVIMLLLGYLAIFGLTIGDKTIIKGAKSIKTGLDISGGVTIVYQAEPQEGAEITQGDLDKSKAVIQKRLEAKNIYDYIIRLDYNTNQINVEIPTGTSDTSVDPLAAVEGLDKTAVVQFRDTDGNVLLQGEDIKSAQYSEDAVNSTGIGTPHVVLTFSEEGQKKFADATGKLAGKAMPIYLDEECIASPYVESKIDSSTAIITVGDGTFAEKKKIAEEYAMLIDSGSLPFNLNVINKEYIGPYVGQQALGISVKAGAVALILVCLIIIVIYRLPGIVSTIALVIYTALLLLIMANTGITLTLSGIAGLILSVGMAVDANVIIFERLKEELDKKLSYKKAFEKSYKNAMSTIVDGNITTIIVALVLYGLGSGMIKGFGIVLALGVVLSLFTALVVSKFILKQFMPLASKGTFLFGLKKEVK
ncbi:MAG: protein translocase subunit SecD [Clostridia bacterium]|nr:protein translocase subunit SecD [Clostridia bacterium]